MKTTSLYALAAAGILMGGMAFASAPVKAADLGNGSDLEERVAELEATTVRKGNRKVSLELYGQVNRALLVWNDGKNSDSYVVDNQTSPSRFGLKGDGKFAEGWKSGFWLEFDVNDSASHTVDNYKNHDEGNGETVFATRQANLWVESDRLGRVTIGHGSSATDDLTLINLSGAAVATDARGLWNSSFKVKDANNNNLMDWRHIVSGMDTDRGDFVRYDTPSLFGFIVSTAWGENDQWDIALKFKQEWNSIRFAGGIGYYYQGDKVGAIASEGSPSVSSAGYGIGDNTRRDEVKGSFSVMHVPTGIYMQFAAGQRSNEARDGAYAPDQGFWYIQGGIDRRFFSVGNTTLYGEYGNYSDFGAGNRTVSGASMTTAGVINNASGGNISAGVIANSDVDRWGFGVVQKFDASALEVYANYQHFTADIQQFTGVGTNKKDVATENFDAAVVGARVKF